MYFTDQNRLKVRSQNNMKVCHSPKLSRVEKRRFNLWLRPWHSSSRQLNERRNSDIVIYEVAIMSWMVDETKPEHIDEFNHPVQSLKESRKEVHEPCWVVLHRWLPHHSRVPPNQCLNLRQCSVPFCWVSLTHYDSIHIIADVSKNLLDIFMSSKQLIIIYLLVA